MSIENQAHQGGERMTSGEVWWWPTPTEGESVPDHPPVLLGRLVETNPDDEEGA